MDQSVKECIIKAVKKEPYARTLNMELVELGKGLKI